MDLIKKNKEMKRELEIRKIEKQKKVITKKLNLALDKNNDDEEIYSSEYSYKLSLKLNKLQNRF